MLSVESRVKNVIAHQMNIDVDNINDETVLADDLGADSLDLVELTMAIEEEFNGEIPDEDADKLKTVGDAVKYVEAKIAEAKKNQYGPWRE